MPAGTDLIFFDNAEDWETVVNTSRTARIINPNSHTPIPEFDLGVELNTDYVAVVAGTTSGKSTWFFAGSVTQVYDFAPGGANPVLGKIKPKRTPLAINRLQVVETNRISTDSFRLQYSPPSWFKDCTIRVYKYTGDKLNFVEDSLFKIGNALGVDPNNPDGKVALALAALRDDIDISFTELLARLDDTDVASDEAQLQLIEQVNQLDAGVFTLAEGLAELLPPDRGNQIIENTQRRLNLDLGFL